LVRIEVQRWGRLLLGGLKRGGWAYQGGRVQKRAMRMSATLQIKNPGFFKGPKTHGELHIYLWHSTGSGRRRGSTKEARRGNCRRKLILEEQAKPWGGGGHQDSQGLKRRLRGLVDNPTRGVEGLRSIYLNNTT